LALIVLSGLSVLAAPRINAQVPQPLLQFNVTSITPSTVSADSSGELSVSGTMTNTSSQPLHDIEAIFQRGPSTDSTASAEQAAQGSSPSTTSPTFKPLITELRPGQRAPVTAQVPITGASGSLQISQLGDYPVILNINAEPGGGPARRVYETRFTLPVLSLPSTPPAPPADPMPVSLLVPLMDYPRIVRPGPPTVLGDDQLATALAPGGRLYGLVHAVEEDSDAESPLGNSVCFAIDPDLLDTVNAMSGHYEVRHPNGSLTNGTGSNAARQWLNDLRTAVKGRCVIALPDADADVDALARAGLPDLVKGARDGSMAIQQTLGVAPRTNVFWPIDGSLNEQAAADLTAQGVRTMLLGPDNLNSPVGSLQPVRLNIPGDSTGPTVQPIDPLLTDALDPFANSPQRTTALSPPGNGLLSVENTLSALAYQSTSGTQTGATEVLAPPRRWNLSADDLSTLLTGMEQLADEGYLKPTPIPGNSEPGAPESTDQSEPPPADPSSSLREATLNYSATEQRKEIPQPLLTELAQQNFKVGALYRSSRLDVAANVNPAAVTTPLRNALLRATSSAWRGNPGAAREWFTSGRAALRNVLSSIGLEQWDGTITLTSSNASIPVWVTNRLPVTVEVTLRVPEQLGLDVTPPGSTAEPLLLPPHSRRPFYLQTTARRAGQFAVDITVDTANGNVQLGPTKRLQLENFAYGSLTIPLTLAAAALLVVLSIRRLIRRVRRERGKQATPEPASTEITQPTAPVAVEITASHLDPPDGPGPDNTFHHPG
jgi:hypothetical protein